MSRFEVAQLVVTGTLDSGERVDVTRLVDAKLSADVAEVSTTGPGPGPSPTARRRSRWPSPGRTCTVPVAVSGVSRADHVSFVHDVAPVLSRLGCNAGTCHGSAQGKNGFKLSLRGYDPLFDVRALTDELGSRRVNVAVARRQPDAPEADGRRCRTSAARSSRRASRITSSIRDWIADGAKLDLTTPRVTAIDVAPDRPGRSSGSARSSRCASSRPTPTASPATSRGRRSSRAATARSPRRPGPA